MTHYEIIFRIQYDSPFGRFTSTHQGVSISQWCNWDKDYIEIGGLSSIDKEIQGDIQVLAKSLQSKIIRKSLTKSTLGIVFGRCICGRVISPPLDDHRSIQLPGVAAVYLSAGFGTLPRLSIFPDGYQEIIL